VNTVVDFTHFFYWPRFENWLMNNNINSRRGVGLMDIEGFLAFGAVSSVSLRHCLGLLDIKGFQPLERHSQSAQGVALGCWI